MSLMCFNKTYVILCSLFGLIELMCSMSLMWFNKTYVILCSLCGFMELMYSNMC